MRKTKRKAKLPEGVVQKSLSEMVAKANGLNTDIKIKLAESANPQDGREVVVGEDFFDVLSSKKDKYYRIHMNPDGALSCSCPGSLHRGTCGHLGRLNENFQSDIEKMRKLVQEMEA